MSGSQEELKSFQARHKFLVAIDSDGCAFDTMEIKHKECFIPNIIKYWNLQAVSKYARAAAEFVNLYSKWRGINRFPALLKTFDLLREWPDVLKRSVTIHEASSLRSWIEKETKLGDPALEQEVANRRDLELSQALEWSQAVNASIADVVHGVPPFPYLRESLQKVSEWADIIVCSATPYEALKREWEEHEIASFTRVIAGQEMGSKKEQLQLATAEKYESHRVLMVGDAPGDMHAAKANGAFFFPINPGEEEKSWECFYMEASDKFQSGEFTEEYESQWITIFEELLPDTPPWQKS